MRLPHSKAQRAEVSARDGHVLDVWRCEPSGRNKGGVVVLHAVYGLTDHIGDVCALWAEAGYSAVAPSLFDRAAPLIVHPYSRAGADAGIANYAALFEQQIFADIDACADLYRADRKVAVSGFCTGGTWAWRAAASLRFDAQVNFYGSHVAAFMDLRPLCPTIMHYGDFDIIVPVQTVRDIAAQHAEAEVHIYAGAGHAFFNPEQAHPDPDASALAWERSLAFMDRHMNEGPRSP